MTERSRRPRRPARSSSAAPAGSRSSPTSPSCGWASPIARPTVEAARAAAAEAMAAILAAVTGAGVARRDVRTTLLSVQPRYDYRDGKAPALTGYDLANVVEVTVRDLGALGAVIDGALTAGADEPRRPGLPGRRSARGRARRPDRGGRRGARTGGGPGRGRGLSDRRRRRDIVEGGAPPTWPQPKAARLMVAADAGDAGRGRHRPRSRSPSR